MVWKRTHTADGSAESTCTITSCRSFESYYRSDICSRMINVEFVMSLMVSCFLFVLIGQIVNVRLIWFGRQRLGPSEDLAQQSREHVS